MPRSPAARRFAFSRSATARSLSAGSCLTQFAVSVIDPLACGPVILLGAPWAPPRARAPVRR